MNPLDQVEDFDKIEQDTLEYLKTEKYQRNTLYFLNVGLPAGEFGKPFNQFQTNRWFVKGTTIKFNHKHGNNFIFSGPYPYDNYYCMIPEEWLDHHLSDINCWKLNNNFYKPEDQMDFNLPTKTYSEIIEAKQYTTEYMDDNGNIIIVDEYMKNLLEIPKVIAK